MGAPYSLDLRLRVLAALDGGMSKMQAHKTFQISRSTIDDWLKLRQQTGKVAAQTTYRRGVPPAIANPEAFHAFAARHQHSTLAQMAGAWEQESGQKLSLMTFSITLRRLGYTRKKRVTAIKNAEKENAKSLRAS